MTMLIEALAQRAQSRLTKVDRKLMSVLVANPKEVVFLSTNELALRANVHPTSAVRFARKLGFEGYPHLRASLQADLVRDAGAADRVRKRIERLGQGEMLSAFVESEIRALSALPTQVSGAQITAISQALAGSKSIFLFGTGHAQVLTRLLEIRLLRGSYNPRILTGDPQDDAAAILQAGKGDVFVLFTFNSLHPLVSRFVRHCKSRGCVSVVITDLSHLQLRPAPTILVAASRGESGDARSLTVPMAICNTIILELSRSDGGRMVRRLEEIAAFRSKD